MLFFLYRSLHVAFPTPDNPIIIYSNQMQGDLKYLTAKILKKAQKSILLHTYALTDHTIIELLKIRGEEGIDVSALYDHKTSRKLSLGSYVKSYPLAVKGLMHEKILIIDDQLVFLGSANMTYSSLHMHDNIIIGLYAPKLAHFLKFHSIHKLQNPKALLPASFVGENLEMWCLPHQEGLGKIISIIDHAQNSIDIAMFTYTHPQLSEALIRAKNRGVKINLFIDSHSRSGASAKAINYLIQKDISVSSSPGIQLFHYKWALIDQKTLIMGSANWTRAAFKKNHDYFIVLSQLAPHHQKYFYQLIKRINAVSK